MNKEIIIKKGTEHASENWQIETSPNEFDNCKEDFINGALWVVKNLAISDVSNRRELLYALADELDVATGKLTPPSIKTLVINKILGI